MKTQHRTRNLTLVACSLVFLALLLLAGLVPDQTKAAPTPQAVTISLAQIADLSTVGGSEPVAITNAGDGSGRLFIVEQPGRIRIYNGTQLLATPFLNITSIVNSGGAEQGLLGLAFDPDFSSNGYFYVDYTSKNGIGDTVVARYHVPPGTPNVADPGSATPLLTVTQPQENHNGGALQFGPDDHYLYISLGDGGAGGDTGSGHNPAIGNAQDLNSLLGKILRIDVHNNNTGDGLAYDIPPSNPFANDGNPNTRGEIWAYGLRNPWRFSFDRQTHDMFIGDVGQELVEEIDFQPKASTGGENYGWRCREGDQGYASDAHCASETFVEPIQVYDHGQGRCAVTGGYRYRGTHYPQLVGVYFYADYCDGQIWGLTGGSPNWTKLDLLDTNLLISAFGQGEDGELYVADHGDPNNGKVYRVTAPNFFVYLPITLR
jgi:glucose/arabinose dehydrogenase